MTPARCTSVRTGDLRLVGCPDGASLDKCYACPRPVREESRVWRGVVRLDIEPELQAELRRLEGMRNPAQRGRSFERLVADLFRANHFDVRINPGAARPRQTDLLATKVAEVYLIECKWRSVKADIADI